MSVFYCFNGGAYKVNLDDGRDRVPLSPEEAELIFADPELPGNYEDNSISSELNMMSYREMFCQLAVDDEIMFGLVPDATLIRGLWAMPFTAVPGFQADFDLVSIADVYAGYLAGGGADQDVAGVTGVTALAVDFTHGLGDATCDAQDKVNLFGGQITDYRDNAALVGRVVNPGVMALLGDAMYMRLTVTALGSFNVADCCDNCGANMPRFQAGVIYDRLCADKQRVVEYCNCTTNSCSGDCEPNEPPPANVAAGGQEAEAAGAAKEVEAGGAAKESV